MTILNSSSDLHTPALLTGQQLWPIKLRYLWLLIQMLLITIAYLYGYLEKSIFIIILPLSFFITLINIKLHLSTSQNKIKKNVLNYQIEGDLVLFVIFLLLSGGTQNPFYPFFYILVFLMGFTNVHGPWPRGIIVFVASLLLQVMPFLGIVHTSILSAQTSPYLFIEIVIPLITYFIAHSMGKKLNEAYATLEKIQRKEDRMSRLKALGAMSAGLSHEFASPLQAAQLRLQRLKRIHGENEDIDESLLALEDCSQTLHLMGRVHRDLDSTVYQNIDEVTLEDVIHQWHLANPQALLKMELKSFSTKSPQLSFIQTIFNILDNALEANRTSGHIEVRSFSAKGQNIISFKDQGPGIPDEVLARLGQPFNTYRPGGTGLGLYSCELYMNSLGGELRVSNTPMGAWVELRFL